MFKSSAVLERLMDKVEKDAATGCWNFTGSRNPAGYGRIYDGTRKTYAHRAMYAAWVEPIPEGLSIDHLCRNTSCVNPDHLEAVTQRENVLRGSGPFAVKAAQTHCVHGHEFTSDNTLVRSDGRRNCRACAVANSRRQRQNRKAS